MNERVFYVGNCKIESECVDCDFPSSSIVAIGRCSLTSGYLLEASQQNANIRVVEELTHYTLQHSKVHHY